MGESELTWGLPGSQLILPVLTLPVGLCHFHCWGAGEVQTGPLCLGPSGLLDHGTENVQHSYQVIA